MRLVVAVMGCAGLSFAQSTFVADGRLIGAGNSVGLSVEVSERSRKISVARVQVNSDSSFQIELPLDGRTWEFRVLNQRGELIQVIYQWPQRGVPIELRLTEVPAGSSSQSAISLKRLAFQPSSKLRQAFARSLKLKTAGKKAESLAAVQEIVRAEPNWFEAWVELGTGQAVLGESAASADSLRRALTIDPNAAEVYPLLGFTLLRLGQAAAAARIAEKGLELKPDCLKSKYVLGLSMVTDQRPSLRAVALLAEVQAQFPEAMLPLAALLLRLGQFEASRDTAWRYLHMVRTPRTELASSIWREASISLHKSNLK
jgi:tetratricopeptide (TPR) repeat protein